MKPKNKARKREKKIATETNNRVHKIYQEDKHGHLTPYKDRHRRAGKFGAKKPKRKDHR